MMHYKCKECGTNYSPISNVAPPSPNWDDGHICNMKKVEDKTSPCSNHDLESQKEEVLEARMNIIGQNGNDGDHYGQE